MNTIDIINIIATVASVLIATASLIVQIIEAKAKAKAKDEDKAPKQIVPVVIVIKKEETIKTTCTTRKARIKNRR